MFYYTSPTDLSEDFMFLEQISVPNYVFVDFITSVRF